ncbi:MAG TPA: MBL fold metallo-hydrolase, partial [Trueperaceae bacterium]|nr:MBL fold metallo-hydrolase [Trueperaceae bacterium]
MTVPLGPLKANGYLLIEGGDVVVVDPGGEGEDLAAALKERGWTLKAIWLTHAHFDHVGGVAGLLRAAGSVPVHMHPADEQLLRHAAQSAARWNIGI